MTKCCFHEILFHHGQRLVVHWDDYSDFSAVQLFLFYCSPCCSAASQSHQSFEPTTKHQRMFKIYFYLNSQLFKDFEHLLPEVAQSHSPLKQHLNLLQEAVFHKKLTGRFLFISKIQLSDAFLWVPKAEDGWKKSWETSNYYINWKMRTSHKKLRDPREKDRNVWETKLNKCLAQEFSWGGDPRSLKDRVR